VRSGPLAPYAAHLRVYEPLAAFPAEEREHWVRYASRARRRARAGAVAAQEREALLSVVGTPPLVAPPWESAEAFLLADGDGVSVCPWQTRLRCWEALDEMRAGWPDSLVEAVLPAVVVAEAADDHRRWRQEHPDARSHIRTARWYVPVEWFTAVEPEERRLSLAAPRELVYRTSMGKARRRVARALRTSRRSLEDSVVTDSIEDLARWFEEFDYGGLVHLLPDEDLQEDRSAADVADALDALVAGDAGRANAAYRRLVDRWQRVQALEHAN
jgi:hypothetical protein